MRIFMAIKTPEEISKRVTYVQEKLKDNGFYGSWPVAGNTHLTLFFFGEIGEAKVKTIIEIMDKVSTNVDTFKITVQGMGVFPSKGLPRVIWLGCEGNGAVELYKTLNVSLKESGFNFENSFTPHLTVGRLKGVPKNWRKTISEVTYEPVTFQCNSVNLLSSKLTPHGSIYSTIHKSKLGGLRI